MKGHSWVTDRARIRGENARRKYSATTNELTVYSLELAGTMQDSVVRELLNLDKSCHRSLS